MKKITKLLIPIIFLGFILPLFPAHAAGSAIMRMTSAKTDYYVGDTVYVQIQVEPKGETLNTVRAIMDFSGSSVLQISDFTLGTAYPYQSPGRELNNTTQHVNVGGFILVDNVTQNSLFGTLIFKANAVGSSTISFASGSHLISPDQLEKIDLAGCQGITINVIGAPPPPPPPPPVNQAPVFVPVSNQQINLGQSVNFHVSATDPNGDLVNLTSSLPSGAGFNNVINNAVTVGGDFSWTPAAQGVYTVSFTATDNNANPKSSTLTVSIGVNVPPPPVNHPPVFDPVGEKTVNAGSAVTFNVTATDPDGNNVALTLAPLDTATLSPITSGVTSTSKFSWTPQNYGIYYAVFTATDDFKGNPLTSTLGVRITVFGGKCPPCTGGGGTCPICQCEKQEFGKTISRQAPTISSPSHPNQDIWYNDNNPKFTWGTNDQPIGYTFNLDQNPLADPNLGYYFTKDKMFSFGNITDGVWYFHLKAQYLEGWGPTAHYMVKIDTTPPEFFKPSIETDVLKDKTKQYKLFFSALDKSSGVAYYEMKIDDGAWQKAASPYIISDQDRTGKTMTLRAVDNAGNAVEAYVDLQKLTVLQGSTSYNVAPQILPPPTIDYVMAPQKIGLVYVHNVFLVTGSSRPDSTVALHVSTIPEIILQTKTDENGIWHIYINKDLDAGRYTMYAVASLNGINSLPSEMVSFTLLQKFSPAVYFEFPWWWIVIIILIILLLILLIMFINEKIKEKKLRKENKKLYHEKKD